MAYIPQLEDGEKLAVQVALQISPAYEAFNFAVSDEAIYWPAKEAFAMRDATCFKRIRTGQIPEVCVRRLPAYGVWAAAVLMEVVGLAVLCIMFGPDMKHWAGLIPFSILPFALVAGGIFMPLASKGQLGLEVKAEDKTLRWKPPLAFDKASKKRIQETFDQILAACEKSGLRTSRK